ncbi:GIY-YIG nuclease family protein [Parasphingorhabdus sp. JC815]|uniref:GIY-YIG nuclease family protein n=1 Tax=Parasphingorhabdus sp. JC815 TaxID=3232140 RepID=UPI0034593B36
MAGGYIYIMANRYRGTQYIGVTANLPFRVMQHRSGNGSQFVQKYDLHRLVYMERHDNIEDAIVREKTMKKWKREWKFRLIEEQNPNWDDLFDILNG